MPYSSIYGKGWLRDTLSGTAYADVGSVLDVGVGSGEYYDRLHDLWPGADWLGVEVWAPYIRQFHLKDRYEDIIIGDVQWLDPCIYTQDVVIFGDVLEHMPKEEAMLCLARAIRYSKWVVVSVPLGEYPQEEWEGNTFETHVCSFEPDEIDKYVFDWTDGTVIGRSEENGIGVYIIQGCEGPPD